jgi:hypothetical protein
VKTKILTTLFSIALALNLAWEFSHVYLYLPTVSHPWINRNFMLLKASLWDAGYVMVVFILMAFLYQDFHWFKKLNWKNVSLVVLIGFITAAWVEIHALRLDKWAYGPNMPLFYILGYGVGLTPLIQLALTSVLSYLILSRINRV